MRPPVAPTIPLRFPGLRNGTPRGREVCVRIVMQKGVPDTFKGAAQVGGAGLGQENPIGPGTRMVRTGEKLVDLGVDKSRLAKRCVGTFAVGPDFKGFAGRVLMVGGEFTFPKAHGSGVSLRRGRVRAGGWIHPKSCSQLQHLCREISMLRTSPDPTSTAFSIFRDESPGFNRRSEGVRDRNWICSRKHG